MYVFSGTQCVKCMDSYKSKVHPSFSFSSHREQKIKDDILYPSTNTKWLVCFIYINVSFSCFKNKSIFIKKLVQTKICKVRVEGNEIKLSLIFMLVQ